MILLRFAFLFSVGSLLGWLIELIFRRFFSKNNPERRWINPGFLAGPYLPLYGSGLCALYLLANIPINFVENEVLKKLVLFVIMALVMTVIEYITGIIFIIKMKVKLWDYSENWGNIQGVICPLFTFFWGVLAAVYYFLIHPHVEKSIAWLSDHLAFSFFVGMFYGIFLLDLCYSFQLVAKVRQLAKDYEVIVKYEELKRAIRSNEEKVDFKKFLFAFRSEIPIYEHAKKYLELQKTFGEDEIKSRIEKAAQKAKERAELAAEKAKQQAARITRRK